MVLKKVAQVITRMDWGGSPDIVRILCQSLAKDYDLYLITGPSRSLTNKNKEFLTAFKERIIEIPTLRRDINIFYDLISLVRLAKIFRSCKFDLIQANTAKAGFLARIGAKLAGSKAKIVYMPHGHIFYGYFDRLVSAFIIMLEKFAAIFTDRILVLTELEKRDFLAYKIKPQEAIKVIPSGLEMEELVRLDRSKKEVIRQALGFTPSDKIVSLVSRLEAVKGPKYFIEAAVKILDQIKDVKFLVTGDGSLRQVLEKQVRDLGLSNNIRFLGWQDNPTSIIFISDVLVQPSLNEAVGRVILEAQAMGTAVVASRVGGIPEIIKHGSTGMLVEPTKAKQIAQAVITLLNDVGFRDRISKQAKVWVRDNHTEVKMVSKIVSVYQELGLK